jgi:hypothetical protein
MADELFFTAEQIATPPSCPPLVGGEELSEEDQQARDRAGLPRARKIVVNDYAEANRTIERDHQQAREARTQQQTERRSEPHLEPRAPTPPQRRG